MRFQATPFTQNEIALSHREMVPFPTPDKYRVGGILEYDPRATVEIDAVSAEEAVTKLWSIYQNIDDAHLTPDGGRSLMTSDLARLVDPEGVESWWICCSIGWHQIEAPAGYGGER